MRQIKILLYKEIILKGAIILLLLLSNEVIMKKADGIIVLDFWQLGRGRATFDNNFRLWKVAKWIVRRRTWSFGRTDGGHGSRRCCWWWTGDFRLVFNCVYQWRSSFRLRWRALGSGCNGAAWLSHRWSRRRSHRHGDFELGMGARSFASANILRYGESLASIQRDGPVNGLGWANQIKRFGWFDSSRLRSCFNQCWQRFIFDSGL